MAYRTAHLSNLLKSWGTPLLLSFIFISMLQSCGETIKEDTAKEGITEIEEEIEESAITDTKTMDPRSFGGEKAEDQLFIDEISIDNISDFYLGSFVGSFGKNMINITLYKMENGEAEGYSVCAGNFRKITGTYKETTDGVIVFKLDEPGDDKYDGSFEFTITNHELEGTWTPFKTEGNSAKNYTLTKRKYAFDVKNGDHPEASTRLLTEDDVNNLNSDELGYMRNCIYARHGYSFKDKTWRYTFEVLDWYMPTCIDVRDKLTEIEVTNIELIYDYENYFEMYYDDYGR